MATKATTDATSDATPDGVPAAVGRKKQLRRISAATYLNDKWDMPTTTNSLAKLASTGGGPRYRLLGKYPVYNPEDLDEYAESRLSAPVKSTSDYRTPEQRRTHPSPKRKNMHPQHSGETLGPFRVEPLSAIAIARLQKRTPDDCN